MVSRHMKHCLIRSDAKTCTQVIASQLGPQCLPILGTASSRNLSAYQELNDASFRAVLHDPALYPSPDDVIPERYLNNSSETLNPDPRDFAFGYGRRYVR